MFEGMFENERELIGEFIFGNIKGGNGFGVQYSRYYDSEYFSEYL